MSRTLLLGFFLFGCSASQAPKPEQENLQALIFNAPKDAERPGFTFQAQVPARWVDDLEPEVLFPALLQAVGPALVGCGVSAKDADRFMWTGDLILGAGVGLVLQARDRTPQHTCIATTASAQAISGPDFDGVVPVVLVLHPPAAPAVAPPELP